MDQIDLDELELRAKAADPLPWKLKLHLGKVVRITEHGNERYIADCLRTNKRAVRCKKNAAYIVAACNAAPDLIAENRALRERSIVNSGRAFYLADFIADRNLCAFCPVYDECPKGDSMCKAECIGEIHKWADKQAAKEAGE